MAVDLRDVAATVADRLEGERPVFVGEVPDLMRTFREGQERARQRYVEEVAHELELALARWLRQMKFDPEDELAFMRDLAEAAEAPDVQTAIAVVIQEWTATGVALSDSDRREVLTSDVIPDDMVPIDRPS